ncbi:uncharacterized protein LOC116136554 [Pistacia vera]|uniref:uncharacterized protein LOC116136554 n=1 Tax=Pistacia vera TaxID=55513 RepID=UPI001263B7D8|nr:uncharacterized protein LOC116136554 [Pistacia vera]
MASDDSSVQTPPTPPPPPPNQYLNFNDATNPYRLDHGDNPSLSLVPERLTIDNYTTWSRAIHHALRAKNKLGFINGELTRPINPSDPLLQPWERCNDMVTSWLQNSISSSIKSSIALVDDAATVCFELRERFTQQNGSRIFHLKKTLAGLHQDQDPISIYYGKLKAIWDELNIFDPLPNCTCGQLKTLSD